MVLISKGWKKSFDNIKKNCDNGINGGFRKWCNWKIFYFISPFKCLALCAIFITLILSGVGIYALIVIILLALLFIFLP